jgi:hypothetical protein
MINHAAALPTQVLMASIVNRNCCALIGQCRSM